jgi:hypothetical protein
MDSSRRSVKKMLQGGMNRYLSGSSIPLPVTLISPDGSGAELLKETKWWL